MNTALSRRSRKRSGSIWKSRVAGWGFKRTLFRHLALLLRFGIELGSQKDPRGGAQMGREQGDGLVGVARQRRIDDALMLIADIACLCGERHRKTTITLALVVELAAQPQQPGA